MFSGMMVGLASCAHYAKEQPFYENEIELALGAFPRYSRIAPKSSERPRLASGLFHSHLFLLFPPVKFKTKLIR